MGILQGSLYTYIICLMACILLYTIRYKIYKITCYHFFWIWNCLSKQDLAFNFTEYNIQFQ